jgi:hypothetical protein
MKLPEGLTPIETLPEGLTPIEETKKGSPIDTVLHGVRTGAETSIAGVFANRLEALFPSSKPKVEVTKSDDGKVGISLVTYTPEQMYGEDWKNLSWEERTQRVYAKRKQERDTAFPGIVGTPLEDSVTHNVSEFVGSFLDPTVLLPLGTATKGMKVLSTQGAKVATAGALWAGGTEAAKEWGSGEELDPWRIGTAAIGGALLVPALVKGMDLLGSKIAIRAAKQEIANAHSLLDELDAELLQRRALGDSDFDAITGALAKYNIKAQELFDAEKLTDRLLLMPENQKEAFKWMSDVPMGALSNELKPKTLFNDILEPIADRISHHWPQVGLRLRNMDRKIREDTHTYLSSIRPIFSYVSTLSSKEQEAFKSAWLAEDSKILSYILKKNPESVEAFNEFNKIKHILYKEQQTRGYSLPEFSKDWFPRVVVNYKGLAKKLEIHDKTLLDNLLEDEAKRLKRDLTMIERSTIVNQFLSRRSPAYATRPTSVKKRGINIPEPFKEFYASPEQAVHLYIRETMNDIHKRDFFGKHLKTTKVKNAVDIHASVGALLDSDPILKGNEAALHELTKLLNVRFIEGEKSPHKIIQSLRNTNTVGYLANPYSAIQQTTDIGTSMYRNGTINTIKAMVGKKHYTAIDAGLRDAVQEMETSLNATSRWIEKRLKQSGFTWMDMKGKSIFMEATLRKHQKLALTNSGQKQIIKKYVASYGDDIFKLIESLKKDPTEAVKDPNVRLLIWNELAKVQPIAQSEMPYSYLANPNLRIFYSLKSYTVKQINIINQDIIRELRTPGHRVEGAKNLLKFATLMTIAGAPVTMVNEMLKGKEVFTAETASNLVVNNLLKIMGASTFMLDDLAKGSWDMAVSNLLLPPMTILRSLGQDAAELAMHGTDVEISSLRSGRYVPVVGAPFYYLFGRGMENDLSERAQRNKRAEQDKAEMKEKRNERYRKQREKIKEQIKEYDRFPWAP